MQQFQRAGSVGEFSEGLLRVFALDGQDVAVVSHEGRFYAFSGRCPHAGYALNYTRVRPGDRVMCSSHMGWFDLKTGKVLSGPADRDLCVYAVHVDDGEVFVSTATD